MKRKVLFVITKASWGGAQRYVYDLATHLPSNEFEVGAIVGGEGLLKKKLEDAHIHTFSISSMQRDISLFKELHSFFVLYRVFKKERPDVVHLNSSKAGALGSLAARMAGIKNVIFTAHGWPFTEKRNIFWRLFAFLGSYITALLSHNIIVVSEYDLKIAGTMPLIQNKTVRIYNGIDLNFSLQSGDVVRQSFPKGAHITGTIGELNNNKNHIALIEEARNKPDMHIAIVGDGENRLFLKKKIQEYGLEKRVKLFGFMLASTVLRGFDVFALPSLKEGLPYVLLEAKAAGLPIEASRVGGVPEILDNKDLSEFSLARMLEKTITLYRS